jgi:hypothetical protein
MRDLLSRGSLRADRRCLATNQTRLGTVTRLHYAYSSRKGCKWLHISARQRSLISTAASQDLQEGKEIQLIYYTIALHFFRSDHRLLLDA